MIVLRYIVGMLYVFCGDRFSARETSKAFVAACRKKREHAEYIHLSSTVGQQSLEELLFGQGLFERKYIVFCDEILRDSVAGHLFENLSSYHESPHMFVLFEPSLGASDEKQLSGAGAVVQRCAGQAQPSTGKELFVFTDVFLRRNTSNTFVALHRLLEGGELPSSILTILLWQLRTLVLVSLSETASQTGLKPFVYTKAKRALSQFGDPFSLFVQAEDIIRSDRLAGVSDAEIVEHVVLSVG